MSVEVMKPPPRTMLDVYYSLPEGTRVQLIKNKLIMSPSPLDIHQKISAELFYQLMDFVKKHGLGEMRDAPYDVRLDEENIFQPDIIFIAKENIYKIKKHGLYGAPDLVIEILSPSNAMYDKKDKKEMYERYGVKEYWIVDPKTRSAEGFFLKDGKFESFAEGVNKMKLKLLNAVLDLT